MVKFCLFKLNLCQLLFNSLNHLKIKTYLTKWYLAKSIGGMKTSHSKSL